VWENQEGGNFLPAWYQNEDKAMLPGFVTETLSKDDVGFTQGLYQRITANSTVTQDTPFSYLQGKPKTKTKKEEEWGVHFKGRTLGEKKDVFVEYSGQFAKKDPKSRGDFRKELGRDETAEEKKARLNAEKLKKRQDYLEELEKHDAGRVGKPTYVWDAILKKMVLRIPDIPDDIPDEIPDDIPDEIPDDIPDEIPDDIPDEIPDDIPDDIPGPEKTDTPTDTDPHQLTDEDQFMAKVLKAGYEVQGSRVQRVNGFERVAQFDSNYVSVWDDVDGGKRKRIIIVRGTKGLSMADWYQNAHIALTGRPQDLVSEELVNILKLTVKGTNVRVAGHSLGSSLITRAYNKKPEIFPRISKTFLFNPPYSALGMGSTKDYEKKTNVRYLLNPGDVVSTMRNAPTNFVMHELICVLCTLKNHSLDQWLPDKMTEKQKEIKEFVVEQMGADEGIKLSEITPEKYPSLSFNELGEVTLSDDPTIHKRFDIPKHFSAVLHNNVLHQMYHPSEVIPKFANTQPVVSGKDSHD
jgi:hypothetical protein